MEFYKKTGYIKITKKSIEEMFDICNEQYFGNRIEKPMKFDTFTPFKKCLGMVRACYDKKRKNTGQSSISRADTIGQRRTFATQWCMR